METKQLKDYTDQEILNEARKRLQETEPIDLLEDIGQLIKDQRINNNWTDNGDGCSENNCNCRGTEYLSYCDDNWTYTLYLEKGIFEKKPRKKPNNHD